MTGQRLVAVRHGAVVVPAGWCYGQSDVPLVRTPEQDAAEVIARLDGWRPEIIATSPWLRTAPVAQLLGEYFGVVVRVDSRLSELAFGAFENRAYAAIEREDPEAYQVWMGNWETIGPPGGESANALRWRVAAWHSEWRASAAGTLVMTHAGAVRALRVIARGITMAEAFADPVEHLRPEVF